MNEHQNAGHKEIVQANQAKVRSSNNSATVEGLSPVSSNTSQDMKSWISCEDVVWSTSVE